MLMYGVLKNRSSEVISWMVVGRSEQMLPEAFGSSRRCFLSLEESSKDGLC